jgi:CelD/BcsL family acetyltransferase involved in cellulose biosynthesis
MFSTLPFSASVVIGASSNAAMAPPPFFTAPLDCAAVPVVRDCFTPAAASLPTCFAARREKSNRFEKKKKKKKKRKNFQLDVRRGTGNVAVVDIKETYICHIAQHRTIDWQHRIRHQHDAQEKKKK